MLAILATVAALQVSVSPVQKVIQLLGDLKAKVEADIANEATLMEEYTAWCGKEGHEKDMSIAASTRTRNDLMATVQDAKASIGTLTSETEELTTKISSAERELDEATKIRASQHADFADAEKELVGTVDSLDRARTVLKKNLGFLQGSKVQNVLGAMASGLQKVIDASWVTTSQKQMLQSLLETNSDDEQPQATVSSYSSQSSGILDTMADMQEKAEQSLTSTRKDEMQAAHSFAMLKQGLEDELEVMKKKLSEKTQQRSTTTQELHSAETGLTETLEVLATDEKYLEELKQSCMAKVTDWDARQHQAAEETEAIQKAKDILTDGVKAMFIQMRSTTKRVQLVDPDVDTRARVVAALQKAAREGKSFSLAQLSGMAKSDPFGKIRGLCEQMIAKLEKAAAEEADQKAFCDEELSESRKKQKDLSNKVGKSSARIDKAVASKAKLAEEVIELESEVSEISAGQAEATKIRQGERADFEKASADYSASASAVAKAIEVLQNYYGSASFVQVSGGPKTDVGSAITSMLEVAEADFTRLLADAEASEQAAQDAYDKLSQENAVAKATKEAEAKGKADTSKQLEVALGNFKDNKATTSAELDAVLTYLDKLKPQCETKVMSYSEKKARREAEVRGLQEALTLLSG